MLKMVKRLKRFFDFASLMSIGVWALSAAPQPIRPSPLSIGSGAPVVQAVTLDGEPFDLSSPPGRVFLTFFSTTCHWSEAELPYLADFARARQDVTVIAVNYSRESADAVKAYMAEHDMPYTVLLDPNGDVTRAYQVGVTPTSFVIEGGRVRFTRQGGGPNLSVEKLSLWADYGN
ncbi:MAG: TlpA disulfide reductase family protein, partial [Chloroflexota bacterium]